MRGRQLVAVRRWRPGAPAVRVLVIGQVHGDERAGAQVARLLRRGGLPEGIDLWVVPTANPDGLAARTRVNARGVDLNRNFPVLWRARGARGSSTWPGPSAASEPETRALLGLVRRVDPQMTVVLHQPLHGVDSYGARARPLVRALAERAGLPVKTFSCGSGGCSGTFGQWHNTELPGSSVTVELERHPSAARVQRVARAVLEVAATLPPAPAGTVPDGAAASRRTAAPHRHPLRPVQRGG
ncbi:murein peptide amidase A [Motilibacter sp. K478]|nr:murein peptide amidase A [Motilibacter aurantiacus]